MKAAFAVWNSRIAPVFDTSGQICLIEAEDGRIISQCHEILPDGLEVQKAQRLDELGVRILVCGAISRFTQAIVASYDIQVISFVSGDLQEIISAWLSGVLGQGLFVMPGCCGRQHFLTGSTTNTKKEDSYMMRRNRGRLNQQGRACLGRMGGPLAAGPGGTCLCPQCGHTEPHGRGIPCSTRQCPKCGAFMRRQ